MYIKFILLRTNCIIYMHINYLKSIDTQIIDTQYYYYLNNIKYLDIISELTASYNLGLADFDFVMC